MCTAKGNIVYRGTTRHACTLFNGRLLRPESYVHQRTDLNIILLYTVGRKVEGRNRDCTATIRFSARRIIL